MVSAQILFMEYISQGCVYGSIFAAKSSKELLLPLLNVCLSELSTLVLNTPSLHPEGRGQEKGWADRFLGHAGTSEIKIKYNHQMIP